jgi:16S rRNA (guanine527-N7)-methyltransferase
MATTPPNAADLRARLAAGLSALGPALDDPAVGRLLDYVALLHRWNRAVNLTAVREPEEMVTRHLLDSLAILPWVRGPGLLDAGTGPGLPGIPIAIARPDIAVTLLDSNGKKVRFCRQAVSELALANVTVVQARVEAFHPAALPATVTARAVADLPALVSATRHLLAGGAHLLAMKGIVPGDEVARVQAQGYDVVVHRLEVPGVAGERHLIEVHDAASIAARCAPDA